jgi:hypothetical protein
MLQLLCTESVRLPECTQRFVRYWMRKEEPGMAAALFEVVPSMSEGLQELLASTLINQWHELAHKRPTAQELLATAIMQQDE